MESTDHSNLISEFCKVTGADADKAQRYLEATGWDHNLAIASYFEESEESDNSSSMYNRPPSPKPASKATGSSGGPRIATFSNLLQNQESDEEEGQAFYAGGSERSGQQVLGPSKRKAATDIVQEMFKSARTFGAEEIGSSKGATKLKAFCGTGYILGSTPDSKETVTDETKEDTSSEPLDICLKLWLTGFTINEGSIREYSDPQNREFLDTVRKGEIPAELRHTANGREVHVKLEDHSHEEYVPRRPQVQAFSGAGIRLGNVTPAVATLPAEESPEETTSKAQKSIGIDDSKPLTSLQIRLADGSRLTMQANHNHTIGAVRRFIVEARPEYATSVFSLMIPFPPKELVDDNATLEDENLLNAVVVQRLK